MDFSQQYADTSLQDNSSMSSNYRLYPPYTERDDMSSMMFSASSNSNESTVMSDRQRQHHQSPMLILNPQSISDPWQNLQNNHTPQTNFHQPGDLSRPSLPHSERGIAGFVSKLYQYVPS
jgi:hypothetical protein